MITFLAGLLIWYAAKLLLFIQKQTFCKYLDKGNWIGLSFFYQVIRITLRAWEKLFYGDGT